MTKIIENKVPLSLREKADNKVLFRLFNPKRDKITIGGKSRDIKSFIIYEKSRLSSTLKQAFDNSYRKVDIEYDTTANSRFKKVNLLVDVPVYLSKDKKKLYEELLASNREFIKKNKVSQSILDNQKYFEQIIAKL